MARKPVETGLYRRSPAACADGLHWGRDTVCESKMVEAAGIEPASGCPSSGPSTWIVVLFRSRSLAARQPAASEPSHRWFSPVVPVVDLTGQPARDVRPAPAGTAPGTGYRLLGSHQHASVGTCVCARCFRRPPRNLPTQASDDHDPVETSRPHQN